MIKTELQKLVRTIHQGISDEHFLENLRRVLKSKVVDMPSLISKLRDIKNNLKSSDTATDMATEIKAASQFCGIPCLNSISFGEKPDIRIKIEPHNLSVEVKRFRFRGEDVVDTQRLANYNGILQHYGNPECVQNQIERVLQKKAREYTGQDPFFIYLWSDSACQVENSEIICAARSIGGVIGGRLLGVFYKWAAYPRNLILLESSPLTNDIRQLLEPKFKVLT